MKHIEVYIMRISDFLKTKISVILLCSSSALVCSLVEEHIAAFWQMG